MTGEGCRAAAYHVAAVNCMVHYRYYIAAGTVQPNRRTGICPLFSSRRPAHRNATLVRCVQF